MTSTDTSLMIRPGDTADLPSIAAIWNHQIAHSNATFTTQPKTKADLARLLADHPVLVACPGTSGTGDDGVLGFATYGPFRGGPGYAQTAELSIYIATDAQRRGVGTRLLLALMDHAAGAGIHVLVAGCAGDNSGAQALHQAAGFEVTARMPEVGIKFGARQDLVLMQKILGAPLAPSPRGG